MGSSFHIEQCRYRIFSSQKVLLGSIILAIDTGSWSLSRTQGSLLKCKVVSSRLVFVEHCTERRELGREGPPDVCMRENCSRTGLCWTYTEQDAMKNVNGDTRGPTVLGDLRIISQPGSWWEPQAFSWGYRKSPLWE